MIGKWIGGLLGGAKGGESRFMVYYGHSTPDIERRLGEYDLVVVEPAHWTGEQVRGWRSAGTNAIGYVAVMESPSWNVRRAERLRADDFLRVSGERVRIPEWDAYLMDLRSAHYRRVLTEEVGACFSGLSMNGAFLDTVGDLDERIADPILRNELAHAYLEWLGEAKSTFPGLWLMQNRGFQTVASAAPRLDAFLWEDWRAELADHPWGKEQLQRLRRLQRDGLELYALSLRPEARQRDGKAAAKHGMHYLARDEDYASWPKGI